MRSLILHVHFCTACLPILENHFEDRGQILKARQLHISRVTYSELVCHSYRRVVVEKVITAHHVKLERLNVQLEFVTLRMHGLKHSLDHRWKNPEFVIVVGQQILLGPKHGMGFASACLTIG